MDRFKKATAALSAVLTVLISLRQLLGSMKETIKVLAAVSALCVSVVKLVEMVDNFRQSRITTAQG